jgi:ferredoxin
MTPFSVILTIIAGFSFVFGLIFTVYSILENESRAAWRGFWLTLMISAGIQSAVFLPEIGQKISLGLIFSVVGAGVILFFLPTRPFKVETGTLKNQVDERGIIFARARLIPGSENYQKYYRDHPEHQKPDDEARKQPGLLHPEAKFTDQMHTAATAGSFTLTEALRDAVDGEVSREPIEESPQVLTQMVNKLARYYGADDCGITTLNPSQIYSHIGRGAGVYGEPIKLSHPFGIAFTVEMDFEMTRSAPYPPLTMESGRQYVESARVAVQLAAAIRELGYPARAHIDGNYRVIAPLVARDAGLGEIGRMGLLMTPRLGPRVRVGVVTTDMPLVANKYQPDLSVLDFCDICEKCAKNCPSQSIPSGERKISNGVLRWQINAESCYHYWTVVGTDCGRCMAVCPYSHPDNLIHNLVRWGIRKSATFRRAALKMDDFLYGRKPVSKFRSYLP